MQCHTNTDFCLLACLHENLLRETKFEICIEIVQTVKNFVKKRLIWIFTHFFDPLLVCFGFSSSVRHLQEI